jgi:predicted NUDIX family NTP pyrophosphohydrolase
MPRVSAGIVLYRTRAEDVEVLLAHPGGPFFRNKDLGAWSIPKGEANAEEELLESAKREFMEETGVAVQGPFVPLKPVKQKGGKVVHAWACEGDCDPAACVSSTFKMEWPPRSGRQVEFPEIDRAAFFDLSAARQKIHAYQLPLLKELETILNAPGRHQAAK